jgi:predicted DNA-binding transcriptional regulator AlpA
VAPTLSVVSNEDSLLCRCSQGHLLTLDDLVAELDVSKWTLYEWARKGAPYFPSAVRLPNRQIRVRRADLEAWLEGRMS